MGLMAKPMTAAKTLEPAIRLERGACKTKPETDRIMENTITAVTISSISLGTGSPERFSKLGHRSVWIIPEANHPKEIHLKISIKGLLSEAVAPSRKLQIIPADLT